MQHKVLKFLNIFKIFYNYLIINKYRFYKKKWNAIFD